MDTKQRMLSRVPLFKNLGTRELDELAMNSEEMDVHAGRVLARQGEAGQEFFVIVDGRIGIDRNGTHLRDLEAGDYFGEMALLSKGPRTASATALADSRLVVLTRQQFLSLMTTQPSIQECVLECVGERLARLELETATH